ncbi:hypothetical protein MHU86_12446 [Fragilaria crotonensis]|nr:hypothetical protein MHU86_12446 [Fragilaria crotonensis]
MARQDGEGGGSSKTGTQTAQGRPVGSGAAGTAALDVASKAYNHQTVSEHPQLSNTSVSALTAHQPPANEQRGLRSTTSDSMSPRHPGAAEAPNDPATNTTVMEGGLYQAREASTFHSDAASARRSRLRFEAEGRGQQGTTSAAEHVRNRVTPRVTRSDRSALPLPEETKTTRLLRGEERNANRLKAADAADRTTLGESPSFTTRSRGSMGHLPGDAALFFPRPIVGPNDEFAPPDWFLMAIRRICKTPSPTPSKPPIRFELTEQAAIHNASVLELVDFDIGRLIRDHTTSTLGFGSEFRRVSELRPLLGRHPHFPNLEQILSEGMHYVFNRELSQSEREKEVAAMMIRGNHKSAQSEQEQVRKLLAKDVLHGFSIPIPIGVVKEIPGAMVQPLGLVQQWTVGPDGTRSIKYRLTQDLSFSTDRRSEPTSINSRVDMSAYVEMIYGWCFPRIVVHYIVSLRFRYPDMRVLISKYDYSDAYRRIAHSAEAATQTISINGNTAYLSLRLTFGGSPNPPTWCMFSELVTDLANEIGQCSEWDPEEIRSPAQPVTPEPMRLPESIGIAKARRMAVTVPMTKAGGRVDGFIDDLINVFADTPENCRRQPHVVPLAMHVTSRPHAGDKQEPIPRRPILSLPKLIAEGRPVEVQIVLGWRVDTRRLEVSLPDDKHKAWSEDVVRLIDEGHCGAKELETLVGRLNHASYIIPNARHFMSRIRKGLDTGKSKRKRRVSKEAVDDLRLWVGFLGQANRGVSMNLLVTREPDKVCWSDACPLGMGGYSVTGRAWRLRIPGSSPILGHKGVNNLLEFVGMAINIWLACLESEGDEACILAIGDNTSAIGWLHNSSRLDTEGETHRAHLIVARKIATLLAEHQCCLASQHLKGELNVVADLLSFAGNDREKKHPIAADNPANDELTTRFLNHYPSQVPATFAISQLPTEILSWTTRVLQVVESSLTVDRRAATSPMTGLGGDGEGTAITWVTQLTPSSLCYPTTSGSCSSGPSSTSTEPRIGAPMADLRELVASQWSQVLCGKPQATWLRRFGTISGSVPCTSRERPTSVPSSDPGFKHARTGTRPSESNAR